MVEYRFFLLRPWSSWTFSGCTDFLPPVWSPSGWTLQGSEPSRCVCPQWGWGESCAAPPLNGASADRLTGCRERRDAGARRMNLEEMMMMMMMIRREVIKMSLSGVNRKTIPVSGLMLREVNTRPIAASSLWLIFKFSQYPTESSTLRSASLVSLGTIEYLHSRI